MISLPTLDWFDVCYFWRLKPKGISVNGDNFYETWEMLAKANHSEGDKAAYTTDVISVAKEGR